jgi:hypothetical protein
MVNIDWSKVKFRASSWGNLLAEPQTKADREAGRLGMTCQKELIKIYNLLKYGRKKDLTGKQIEKGTVCEPESINLYSMVEGVIYEKNEQQLENEWFTGHPDLYLGSDIYHAEEVDDIKTRWDIDTFTPKLIEKVDAGEIAQMNVYYSLTGATKGAIVNTLVSAPDYMVEEAKYYALKKLNAATEYSPEAIETMMEIELNMKFEDIPIYERVIKTPVERDDELIEKMKSKVPIFRQWLADFDQKHRNQYPQK